MTQMVLIAATTAGATATVDTSNYQYVTFTAPALATTETCTVSVSVPDGLTAVAAKDVNGTATGLSATNKTRTFFGGPTYKLVLSTTAGSCGVYADFGASVD